MGGMAERRAALVVGAGAAILAIAMGSRQTMGLYLPPMTLDLGLSHETFGLAIALQNLLWGALQPFTGALADRWGAGKMIAFGALCYAAGLVGMTVWIDPVGLMLSAGVLIGIGLAGCGFAIVYGAVVRAVPPERRASAIATVSLGSSVGLFASPQLAQIAIGGSGWQVGLWITGGVVALVLVLAGMLGVGARKVPAAANAAPPPLPTGGDAMSMGTALATASRNQGFLYLTAGFFVCGFHVTFIGTHLPGFVASCGLAPEVGGWALGVIGLANVYGTWAAGWFGDRYRQKHILSLIYLGRAAIIAALVVAPKTEVTIYAFSAVFGLLWLSTVPLTGALVARLFGAKHVGMLFGIVFFSHQVGAFLGAWLGGRAYDATGNYDAMWIASILLGLLAAALHWPIRDQPAGTRIAATA
ncbi:MAG: MFS transporter [Alphaproteobacteria bacterium]|nr:MFS transporter [Alphaproteobacteria bacterium]